MEDEILDAVLNEIISDEIFEFHFCIKTNRLSVDELYSHFSRIDRAIVCPKCSAVIGVRFAPHLDKCLKGGKRNLKKSNFKSFWSNIESLPMKLSSPFVDPFPNSLVVSVQLCKGSKFSYFLGFFLLSGLLCYSVPKKNQTRKGSTIEEFLLSRDLTTCSSNENLVVSMHES